VVDAATLLGVELPALPASGGPARPPAARGGASGHPGTSGAPSAPEPPASVLCRTAIAAQDAGFGSVWIAGTSSAGRDRSCDPCALAGGLAALTSTIVLGVVAGLGDTERLPSVLARDITALDVLSAGRAAVLLDADGMSGRWMPVRRQRRDSAPVPTSFPDGSEVGNPLAEALTVCRMLFSPGPVSFTGSYFWLEGAVNLPPPVRSGGPLLLSTFDVDPTCGPAVGTATAAPDAWVVSGGPDRVAKARDLLDARERSAARRGTVVWRGRLPQAGDIPRFVAELRDAGAGGLIVRAPEDWTALPEEVGGIGAALVPLISEWGLP